MPFGLKNVWATYQMMMTRMFRDKIGSTVEVYIDDMVVERERERERERTNCLEGRIGNQVTNTNFVSKELLILGYSHTYNNK